mmetsp:Transcript_67473/g.161901  ORF Transcript_67473/g.161901 Transcript_67473/m.161901 type:complete len:201 (+) Transcript_67473:1682-2284(+)
MRALCAPAHPAALQSRRSCPSGASPAMQGLPPPWHAASLCCVAPGLPEPAAGPAPSALPQPAAAAPRTAAAQHGVSAAQPSPRRRQLPQPPGQGGVPSRRGPHLEGNDFDAAAAAARGSGHLLGHSNSSRQRRQTSARCREDQRSHSSILGTVALALRLLGTASPDSRTLECGFGYTKQQRSLLRTSAMRSCGRACGRRL